MRTDVMVVIFLYLFLGIICLYLIYRVNKTDDKVEKMWIRRERLYESLADPLIIDKELERSAQIREAKDANRTTLPRDDQQGPNAIVHRPKLRSKLPGTWNPPRVNRDRKC